MLLVLLLATSVASTTSSSTSSTTSFGTILAGEMRVLNLKFVTSVLSNQIVTD